MDGDAAAGLTGQSPAVPALGGAIGAAGLTGQSPAPLRGPEVRLATRADDAELRRLLRDNAMPGAITLGFEREPDYFAGLLPDPSRHQTLASVDAASGRLVAMGSRAVSDVYLDGLPAAVGYLSQLRVDRAFRSARRILKDGYAWWPRLRGKDEAPFDLTSILKDNTAALRLLQAGVRGLPRYRALEEFSTLVMPVRRRPHRGGRLRVERGSPELGPAIAACLDRNARRHQFACRWSSESLGRLGRAHGLGVDDFLVALDGSRVVGCLAGWDQQAFKQIVVRGYDPRFARWRRVLNGVLGLFGYPRLPEAGRRFDHAYVSHVAVDGDDPAVFEGLLEALHAARAPGGFLIAGFASRHPFARVSRESFLCLGVTSLLHTVSYDEAGERAAERLDGRIPHPEVALL